MQVRSAAPRVVLTLGLHGSASTWAFNVARELMEAALGPDAVAACFANTVQELLAEPRIPGRHLVCKLHGWPGVEGFAHLTRAAMVLTVRDPRDAVCSLVRRFGTPLGDAVRGIVQDCGYALWAAASGCPVLRYEDRFFDDRLTVRRFAAHLGVTVGEAEVERIFAAYRTEAVRAFAARVAALPPERRVSDGRALLFDRVTQIHHTHIGEVRSGQWRECLTASQRAELTRCFAPFLARFDYPGETN